MAALTWQGSHFQGSAQGVDRNLTPSLLTQGLDVGLELSLPPQPLRPLPSSALAFLLTPPPHTHPKTSDGSLDSVVRGSNRLVT